MGERGQGLLAGLTLLLAVLGCGVPSDLPSVAILLLTALAADHFSVVLSERVRFSPALTILLGAALMPEIGGPAIFLFVMFRALMELNETFLGSLSGYLSLSFTMLGMLCLHLLRLEPEWLTYIIGPLVYLVLQWKFFSLAKPTNLDQKQLWYHLHLKIRPLELGFAAAAPLVVICHELSPVSIVLLLPLLATGRLAAETVLLKSHDQSLDQVLQILQTTAAREKQTKAKLTRERRQKQVLEGFSSMLADKPTLSQTAQALLETAQSLVTAQNSAVFLGDPPEPFCYLVTKDHQSRLQGAALTGWREPVVDQARAQNRPIHQRKMPENPQRLFPKDHVAAALPLGRIGVLYLGRESTLAFHKDELTLLSWLADKAEIALDLSYREQESLRRQGTLHRTVLNLESRVAWMELLMQSSDRLISTLSSQDLIQRIQELLREAIPHDHGYFEWNSARIEEWGLEESLRSELLSLAREAPKQLNFEDLRATPYGSDLHYQSLLSSPIQSGANRMGLVVLLSTEPKAFNRQQADLLYLLCNQAAMALSNSKLYEEVLMAQKLLEESQAQLIQSSKMTSMGQLAAGVAHELNSPMGAISLSLEEALRLLEEKPDFARQILEMAQEAVQRSQEIIDRLMGYTRSPLGQFEELDFSSLLQQSLDLVSPQLKKMEVRTEVLESHQALVKGEKQPLQQVLVNLILNGAQAMLELPPSQRILHLETSSSADEVTLEVKDQGCGIEVENLSRVFDPFFTTKPVGQGTGLGLWVCHQILTDHKGQIEVRSQPGQGSVFSITLPRLVTL